MNYFQVPVFDALGNEIKDIPHWLADVEFGALEDRELRIEDFYVLEHFNNGKRETYVTVYYKDKYVEGRDNTNAIAGKYDYMFPFDHMDRDYIIIRS